ncbi:MAG: FKBP-type peptidyl-prolyl cis-trans isomerase [Bacteroidota bacterium]|nr:FKBP-type peptidyl-prolyl cis-trans isomerase [Bacteroidota bacterium]
MKKYLGSVFLFSMLLMGSCGKKDASGCQPASVASEKAQMVAYCNANSINYTEHSSGMLYEIITPGSTIAPVSTSNVSVVYTGKLLNGTTFDATSNPITLNLSNVIDGWKIGIPLIKKGGRIKLVIPSALAYSCTGAGTTIPPNSPLFFDVTLTDVK